MSPQHSSDVEDAAHAVMGARFEQAFFSLTDAEIEKVRHYGSSRRFSDGDVLFKAGQAREGMYVILSGHVAITAHDGLGHVTPVVDQGRGQFIAELASLSDQAIALVDGRAEGDVETLLIRAQQLRALIVQEADLGERMMRALILRRVALLQLGEGGPLVIGTPASPDVERLETFLRRNGHPHRVLDPAADPIALDVVGRLAPHPSELPLVICLDGEVLRNPSDAALAHALGLVPESLARESYDVAIVGCGPAGLATAVYAASEGLAVVVLEQHAFGGQAGASARIENYLGFPTGISGMALAGRAYAQARKFGAEVVIPIEVKTLDCKRKDGLLALELDDGRRVRCRSVVVASGARYRRPAIDNLSAFEGRGVWYWASPFEATFCARQDVIVVGGGNSAGQAAVFLAGHAAKVRMMIRGAKLSAHMSQYLVDRIGAMPNIELMPETEIVALEGSASVGVELVRWRSRRDGVEASAPIRHVFLFIGAEPATSWLAGCGVELDRNGYVVTGNDNSPLESSVPGVFAVGDVRCGSVKRVGGAIGEGAQVVGALHVFLERLKKAAA
ncbi:MAG: FAD-dependent oxidoreductase [Polyangiaceae bacterium]|nr:FAD-dependent oxidoreductase [Polyangiaceae bacterium]